MKAVDGSGMTSMSDSLIACQPRMLEPSNPRPSSNMSASNLSAGIEKCCQVPGKSTNLKSTICTPSRLAWATTDRPEGALGAAVDFFAAVLVFAIPVLLTGDWSEGGVP